MRRRNVEVRLTLVEARAVRDATGYGGPDPQAPRELAALDRALFKINRALHTHRRTHRRPG